MTDGESVLTGGDRAATSLSELGSKNLARERRRLLSISFITGGIGLFIALLVFGGYVIMNMRLTEKTVFVAAPPPRRTYDPRELEHKVQVQKRQRSASRPTIVPRLTAMKDSDMSLQDIKTDPKVLHTNFQTKFKSISGKVGGIGNGEGNALAGGGPGVNRKDFLGIKWNGDKVAILVDASTSMVEEEKGGVAGYTRVKSRVNQVIDSLEEGSAFNVVVFADAADACFKKLVIANVRNKKQAKGYLAPFNTEGNWGLATGNIHADGRGLPAKGGTTRLDLALTAAFQQGADTILILSDGAPMVRRGITSDEMRAYQNKRAEWEKANKKKIQAWNDKQANATPAKPVKVWIPPKPATPPRKGPPKEGEPPDNGRPAVPGHWEWRVPGGGGHGGARKPVCPIKPPGDRYWTLTEFLKHLRLLHEYYYLKQGKKTPVIHCIGYKIDRAGDKFLRALAHKYKGEYLRVKTIKVR